MALIDLKSTLSWYGKKPGFTPNQNVSDTKFTYNDDLSVSTNARGFDARGNVIQLGPRVSLNSFLVDNNSTSFRGIASRLSQLGQGSKFPIGPTGIEYKFDVSRTGFSPSAKYSDIYNALSNTGLANTYVIRKPINEMYNKFKVRDQVYNPYGDPAPPFILRGIQRDDSIDPQRYGNPLSPIDIPRGGFLTAQQRAELDTERISKFLARPQGQWFIQKQSLLHLMNPNREGVDGRPQSPAMNANSSKVFTTFNLMQQIKLGYTGLHNRKHGQFPFDTPGFLPFPPSPPSNYEDIHKERSTGITAAGRTVSPVNDNRLVLIYRDVIRDEKKGYLTGPGIGQTIAKLTDRLGPNSISFDGTIKETGLRRWSITVPDPLREIPTGTRIGGTTSIKFSDIRDRSYSYTSPYRSRKLNAADFEIQLGAADRTTETPAPYKFRDSLLRRYLLALNNKDVKWNAHQNDRDQLAAPEDADLRERDSRYADPQAYSLIQKGNDLHKGAGPGFAKIVDFRAIIDSKGNIKQEKFSPFTRDDNTSNDPKARANRGELMIRRLREDEKEGNRFNAVGDSDRAIADNSAINIDQRDPLTGRPNGKTSIAESEYFNLSNAAGERVLKRNTDIDFRVNTEGEQYVAYKGANANDRPQDETAIKRLDGFDGISRGANSFVRNPASPTTPSDGNISLQKYKTMTYPELMSTARNRKLNYKNPAIVDFQNAGKALDNQKQKYNNQITDSDLINFSIGGIKFNAYISSITDNFSPNYGSEPDQNRADPRYLYTSFERSVDVDFMVVWEKRDQNPWSKLKSLGDKTLPKYGGGPWGQSVSVTIGGLYKNVPMILKSLSYTWDEETPWALEGDKSGVKKGGELPLYTSVSTGFTYMGTVKPAAGSGYVAYG